jgi:O-antigen/teichoic acid export membrane protein
MKRSAGLFWRKPRRFGVEKSSMTLDVATRYVSTGLSFLCFLLLARIMDLKDFAIFQVGYSFAGLAIWLGDLGLGINLIRYLARKDFESVKQIWTLRLATLSCAVFIFSYAGSQLFSSFHLLFFLTAFLDLVSDSHLSLRHVAASKYLDLFIQPTKRGIQLLGLLVIFATDPIDSNLYILVALGLPSLLLIITDTIHFGGLKVGDIRMHLSNSTARWLQSGGTTLTNLDNIILGASNQFIAIAILSITKKIFNAFSIIGTALFPRILFAVTEKEKFEYSTLKSILKTILLVSLPTIAIVVFLPALFSMLWEKDLSDSQLLMSRIFMLLLPVYLLCLALNSVLLGLNLNFQAAIATYSSGFLYLGILFFSLLEINIYSIVIIALIAHAFVWMFVELFFLYRSNSLNLLEMYRNR